MALKIRLRRQGRKNRPFYRMVVADSCSPSDGKYFECLGWYNPFEDEQQKQMHLDEARLEHWLEQGAQMTENAEAHIAKAAPAVYRKNKDRQTAKRVKLAAKRRENRQAKK